ncbi:endophilin-A2-like, partial [Carlito syrichta]|uniref:Endophilin-A2-like n=1 Tax=Carlito syrichta TaxID=1868482 RepID=A0A3Q0DJG6_CARSF
MGSGPPPPKLIHLPSPVPQLVSEKVGGAEGTKLDDDFKEMEKKVDVTSKAVMEVLARTIEYLQPNPASRAKLTMLNTVSKIRGQVKNPGYPQSEGLLGECMIRHGKELGESNFGDALMREASSRPKREFKPKPREPFDLGEPEQSNGGFPCATAPKIS